MKNSVFDKLIAKDGLNVGTNNLKLFKNIDFSMYPARAFALVLQKLSQDKDIKYLNHLGNVMGITAAKEMFEQIKKLKLFLSKDYRSLEGVILLSGFGKVSIVKESEKYIVQCNNHPVISKAENIFGKESNICHFYGSIFASFIQIFENKKNIKFSHTKCLCNGDNVCEWRYKYA